MANVPLIDDRYLGDGVYASYEDNEWEPGISLDLRAQDTTTRIFINTEVYTALLQYVEDIKAANNERDYQEANPDG